jgi:hypothetical protein
MVALDNGSSRRTRELTISFLPWLRSSTVPNRYQDVPGCPSLTDSEVKRKLVDMVVQKEVDRRRTITEGKNYAPSQNLGFLTLCIARCCTTFAGKSRERIFLALVRVYDQYRTNVHTARVSFGIFFGTGFGFRSSEPVSCAAVNAVGRRNV